MPLDAIARREFPRLQGDEIWLNNASTGPLPESARALALLHAEQRMEPWRYGPEQQLAVLDESRQLLARLIGASHDEIALMPNTTSGLNVAAQSIPLGRGDVVIGTDRDFPANVYPWMALARQRGVVFTQLPCTGEGWYDEDALVAALDRPGVKVLVVSWVSFASGQRVDLARLGRACRERGIWFVVDAIQGVGPCTLDVGALDIDVLACGAQKWLLAPWGTGFVYVNRKRIASLEPAQVGWLAVKGSADFTRLLDYDLDYWDDARRYEVLTLPYQDFAVLNTALRIFHEAGPAAIAERIAVHTARLLDWGRARPSATVLTPVEPHRRAGIVSIRLPRAAQLSQQLVKARVWHSLREGAIRLSPHFFTPAAHVERALDLLDEAIASLPSA